jgi:hypothetical protein
MLFGGAALEFQALYLVEFRFLLERSGSRRPRRSGAPAVSISFRGMKKNSYLCHRADIL